MLKKISEFIKKSIVKQVPTTGLGLFRIIYGLVLFQEIIFLLYFNHLIFDPIPYMDVEFPMITFFLGIWGVTAFFIALGYRFQLSAIVNYIFWIVFVSFTPMQRDFDGGFDQFMTGAAFFLVFLPANRAFSIDNLRYKLEFSTLKKRYQPPVSTTVLAYIAPVTICLGFLYLDSGIHKLYSDHWRNGLGAWLPSSLPYYISAVDMSWLLNIEILQKTIGYTIIVFQFAFLFLYFSNRFRPVALFIGISLHLGITISLNIYPFGLGMLAFYPLLVPFSWWRKAASLLKNKIPSLTVFYDEDCPLCNRTVISISHFDIFNCIAFKGLQTHAESQSELKAIEKSQLLNDLYAIDEKRRIYSGLDTYVQVLAKMRYLIVGSWIMRCPGIYHLSARMYRKIADSRIRTGCNSFCVDDSIKSGLPYSVYHQIFEQYASLHPWKLATRLAKVFVFIIALQLNSTLHYGFFYRLGLIPGSNVIMAPLGMVSNSVLTLTTTFLGITPHALYLHDHFQGYNHILGITYLDSDGQEKWLPFINEEGRIIAPNWGRVHSMWANIAVTPHINKHRLDKFIMKVTAFWGIKLGLDLDRTLFIIKLKEIRSPATWSDNLRSFNLMQPWSNVGDAQWNGKEIQINLPDEIEDL